MRAQFGLTTLIIFIALIVTAAVAAGVIIYTTQNLQQQSLQTGAEAKQRVSTGVEVVRVLGYQYDSTTNSLNTGLQQVSVIAPIARLMSGSNPINFNDITMLLTTEKGEFFSVSTSAEIPQAVHARLEGGNVFITGFVYGNAVDVNSVNITDTTVCATVDTAGFIQSNSSGTDWCLVELVVSNPITIEDSIKLLDEMKTELRLQAASLLLGMAIRGENVHLEEGELYEWLLYGIILNPEEKYTIQIIPKGGYVTEISGAVPTVLQSPVEDIWAK